MKTENNYSPKVMGRRLKELRRKTGLSQLEVANKIGVTRSSVANWEQGYRVPDCFTVKLLCRIYKAPVDYIYGTSDHVYNVNVPDYFELDFTRLNDDGMIMLYDYYKYLISSDKYAADRAAE